MYFAYVLKSLKDEKLYIGKTRNLKERIKRHNNGLVQSTKSRVPFKLIYFEVFMNRADCGREEIYLKSGIGRESLKKRLENTLNK